MSFDTPQFFLLAISAVLALHLLPTDRLRHLYLLAASYVFYATWDWRLLGLVMLITAISFVGAQALEVRRGQHSPYLILLVALLLLPLAVFKYFDFFSGSAAGLAGKLGITLDAVTLNLILPIGISFYTFHAISYVADVHAGRLSAERDPIRYALYICFFPQLVAGPIIRSTDFLPQLAAPWRAPDAREVAGLIARFAWGLGKKVLIADRLALSIVDPVFANPGAADPAFAVLAVIAFSLMIYADFSAYSDMAIATAGLLGYRFKENFLSPYWATSIRDFWRRWHVSLSSWIRDYVYIAMGGNRGTPLRATANLMAAMLLCGLWHGAAWTFVLWGLWHGAALVVERVFDKKDSDGHPAILMAGWLVTTVLVLIGWALFRANSVADFVALAGAFVHDREPMAPLRTALLIYIALCAMVVYAEQAILIGLSKGHVVWLNAVAGSLAVRVSFAVVMIISMLLMINPGLGSRNFIYFQF